MAGSQGCVCSGNIGDSRRMGSRTLSPEPPERDEETFIQRYYKEQLCPGGEIMTSEDDDDNTKDSNDKMTEVDSLPIFSTGDVTEVAEQVAAHLAEGFQFSNDSYILQGRGDVHDDHHVSVDMPPLREVPARLPPPAPVALARALWTICLFTLVPAISSVLYEPARGVVFGNCKLAYYLALSAILASGFGEAITAFWLSRPGGGTRRRLRFGRAVLCASVLPFAIVLGIAGYGFIKA